MFRESKGRFEVEQNVSRVERSPSTFERTFSRYFEFEGYSSNLNYLVRPQVDLN